MQPRDIIRKIINDLGDADAVIEALERHGYEIRKRGWLDARYQPPLEFKVYRDGEQRAM